MDPGDELPMILPKGIVINTNAIYKEVASHRFLPDDKVQEYWHVYTTTNKQLGDPTARRLENFWWHVWGSDRRQLHGRVLAKLYEDISLGPTFVPLKGPPNRWEGPDVPPLLRQAMSAIENHSQLSRQSDSQESTSRSAQNNRKSFSSSASKPPPSHPILKKPRGSSSSGPRPTARFVSPHESAEEGEQGYETSSSSNAAAPSAETNTTISVATAPSSSKKKSQQQSGTTKRFVASSSSTKKRPVLSRRASSQSSTASESAVRDTPTSNGTRTMTSSQRPISPILESTSRPGTPGSENGHATVSPRSTKLSEKAAGKRPMRPPQVLLIPKDVPTKQVATKQRMTELPVQNGRVPGNKVPDSKLMVMHSNRSSLMPQIQSFESGATSTSLTKRHSDTAVPVSSVNSISPQADNVPAAPTMMARAQSSTGYERRREGSFGLPLSQSLFTGATAATTNIAAQGTIIDQSGLDAAATSLPSLERRQSDGYAMPTRPPESPLAEAFLDEPLSRSTSLPLGRTRSQLTLLLEREKVKVGEKSRFRG